jgi:ankyrin repeat protein/tetratricopeptide (TPR) repeat protein
MKTKLCLGFVLLTATLLRAQTNDLTGLLQQGLFEEQANRNLDAAIADYQSLASQFDKDSQLAATAVFRLGECYRAQGRTNDAAAEYQRIIRDFPDQQTLATLSRQDLAGLGLAETAGKTSARAENSSSMPVSAEAATLARQIAGIDQLRSDPEEQARAVLAIFPDDELKKMLLHLPKLQEQEVKLNANPQLTIADAASLQFAISADGSPNFTGLVETMNSAHPQTNLFAGAQRELKQQITWIQDRVDFIVDNQKARLKALQAGGGTGTGMEAASAGNSDVQLWNKLKEMPRTELAEVLPTVLPDSTLDSLLKQRNEAMVKMAQLTNDYSLSSVECGRQKALIDELNRQTDERITGMLQGLKLRAELAANTLPAGNNETPAASIFAGSDEDREIRRIQQMVQSSPDLINAASDGSTPLVKAADNGWQKVAAYLLDHGADVNTPSPDRELADVGPVTPLMAAVAAGNMAMTKFLIDHGADVNFKARNGETSLHVAVRKEFQAVIEVLLASHADVNAQEDNGAPPLFAAIQGGHLKIVQALLAAGANVNLKDNQGRTGLNYALKTSPEMPEMFQALLQAGMDPNTTDKDGRTPLSYAAAQASASVVKLLLAAKADPKGGALDAPLLGAIEKRDVAAAEALLQAGANPNEMGRISWEVSINGVGYGGASGPSVTPLYFAITESQLPLVQLLLKYKADPDDSQTDNQSVLFTALDKPEIVRVLLEAGASAEATNAPTQGVPQFAPFGGPGGRMPQGGRRPGPFGGGQLLHATLLQEAARQNQPETVALLLEHGANPAAGDEAGDSALHDAAMALADEKVFALLLDHKANPNVRNNDGKTPLAIIKEASQDHLNWAARFGSLAGKIAHAEELIAWLRQRGALDHLPDWDHITVSRGDSSWPVFYDNSNHWNRFTLLESLLQADASGGAGYLHFPDLGHIVISRPAADGTIAKRTIINLLDATNGIDFARDAPLQFGDVVEIPEREHTLAETPYYVTPQQSQALGDHFRNLAGEARLVVAGGQTVQIPLESFHAAIGAKLQLGVARAALTSNSDLSRVKVIRHDPKTNKTDEWILDCSNQNNQGIPDLWLRAGDVIEVPEK